MPLLISRKETTENPIMHAHTSMKQLNNFCYSYISSTKRLQFGEAVNYGPGTAASMHVLTYLQALYMVILLIICVL